MSAICAVWSEQFPQLKIIFEHITTLQAAEFVAGASDNIAATITPQHLLFNRNHMLVGGISPHLFCLPILKRNVHQHALIEAATSGNTKFFLGTDSAPHVQGRKESSCGCAGCFSHHAAIEFYAEVFEQAGALDQLEAFASTNGPDFYGLPRNSGSITLAAPVLAAARVCTLRWFATDPSRRRHQPKLEIEPLMDMPEELLQPSLMAKRFRGFLPVVVDVETGGFNSRTDALLEIAAVILEMDAQGNLQIKESYSKNIDPFPGAVVEPSASGIYRH